MNPSTVEIHQFILDTFSDEDFELFCAEYFQDAQAEFSAGMSLRLKVLRLIEYCQHRDIIDKLQLALEKERPEPYNKRFNSTRQAGAREQDALQPETRPNLVAIESPFHLELVRVPAGEFLMGSDDPSAAENEQPQHRVNLSEFYIGKYVVTIAQFAVYAEANHLTIANPGNKAQAVRPIVGVSWDDAVAFCNWFSQATQKIFRLPTEAEWEKAARGDDARTYPWGDDWDVSRLNSFEGCKGKTTPVGFYSPRGDSPYGAADMAGNVWEWVSDWYRENEYQQRSSSGVPVKDPAGPSDGEYRVLRGGSFFNDQNNVRCATRFRAHPNDLYTNFGIRVVLATGLPGSKL